jgi:TolA-binding protein
MIPLRRAQVLAHQKQWAAAYALATPIAEKYPGFTQQYEVDYLIGRCLSNQAKFRDAREAYQRVVDSPFGAKTETAAMAEWMIGESYFHQKDYDNAIRAYDRVELLYDFPQWQAAALLQAGKCLELQSKWSDAGERYAQVVQDYPDTTFKEEAARRLQVVRERTAREPSGERGA